MAHKREQLAVDLLGVGDAHDVRPTLDLDVAGIRQRRVQAPALAVDRQDPIGGSVQDERRYVDPTDVLVKAVQPLPTRCARATHRTRILIRI